MEASTSTPPRSKWSAPLSFSISFSVPTNHLHTNFTHPISIFLIVLQAFNVFDKNGDGDISSNELGSVLRSLGQKPTKKSVRLMIKKVDADGSGTIDFDEFLTLMGAKMKRQDLGGEMLKSFKLFDKDGSGKISADELESVLKSFGQSLTPEEIEETLREADKDKDGVGLSERKLCLQLVVAVAQD